MQKPSFPPARQRCTFAGCRVPLTRPGPPLAASSAVPGSSPMTVHRFMFATGIENSYPTIQNGSVRIDELETGGHYKHWETDFALLQDLDIRFLRCGPPIHRTWLAHNRYDWDFADQTFVA